MDKDFTLFAVFFFRHLLLPPRALNRTIIWLTVVESQPTECSKALEQLDHTVNYSCKYIARIRKHIRAASGHRDHLSTDDLRYNASQLRVDYELLRDGRWQIVVVGWTIFLAWLVGRWITPSSCTCSV